MTYNNIIMQLNLTVLPETLAVCRFNSKSDIPVWAQSGSFYSITKTEDELSIVCSESEAGGADLMEKGWKTIKIEGPLDFSLVGIVANLSSILTSGGISIFVISTFDTDYILVKEETLARAVE